MMAGEDIVGAERASGGARDAAIRAIVEHAKRFPDLLPGSVDAGGLDDRDGALAHAIHDAVVRRWLTLRALLQPRLAQPFDGLEPKMKAVLLAGAAQIVLLDRIPPHAAVNESVAWAKRHIRAKAGGLVNAVLRRLQEQIIETEGAWKDEPDRILLSDGRCRVLREPVLPPDDPIERLAVQASCPVALLRRWIDTRGPEEARRAGLYMLASPPTVLNTQFAESPIPHTRAHQEHGHAVYEGSARQLSELLSTRDDVWVQDAASSVAIRRAADLEPGLIVDLCAGRGTKTRQLAHTFPQAMIVATDIDRSRMSDLQAAFAGHSRVRVLQRREVLLEIAGKADLVLLDVPCSNSGVLARRPEAKYRFGRNQMKRLNEIQRQLIADAVPMLAPDGAILYSTCSLEPEEDAAPLAWAAEWHGLGALWTELTWPRGEPGGDGSAYRDGSFAALLGRSLKQRSGRFD